MRGLMSSPSSGQGESEPPTLEQVEEIAARERL
jgi:hypothetical protein